MESGFYARGVLVNTAGFVLGSLGFLLSIVTSAADAFLGQGSLVAFTRSLALTDSEPPPSRHRLRRISSDSSLTVRPPIPTISVTLHQTGNSISSFSALSAPPRRSSVSFAPTPPPPRRPRSCSPSRRDRDEQWLALPPLQTKRRRRPTLNRSTSSPQLTSFAAAGAAFASERTAPAPSELQGGQSTPANAVGESVSDSENVCRGKGRRTARTKEKVRKLCSIVVTPPPAAEAQNAWETVYVDAKGSPNTLSVSEETPVQAPSTEDAPKPERPRLRKSKTLGDLLRRVPSSPGPLLPDPEKLESTTKKAFAFTVKPKDGAVKEPMFCLKPKFPVPKKHTTPGSRPSSPPPAEKKRTQPYEAPYNWIPPDQVLAMQQQQQQIGRRSAEEKRGRTRRSEEAAAVVSPK